MMHKGKKNKIFLTGASGFLGRFLAVQLLRDGFHVYALVRKKAGENSIERLKQSLFFCCRENEDFDALCQNLFIIEGDISKKNFGIKSESTRNHLLKNINYVINSAALTSVGFPYAVLYKSNVLGLKNVLDFFCERSKSKEFDSFFHISTVYVLGDYKGSFDEGMLNVGQGFNNDYEKTKFEAELLIQDYKRKMPKVSIIRTSMILGDSKEGKVNEFKLFFHALRLFSKRLIKKFPADITASQNFITVDSVVRAIVILLSSKSAGVFHIISPRNVSNRRLFFIAEQILNIQMPEFIPCRNFDMDSISSVQRSLIQPFIPYFNFEARIDAKKTFQVLKNENYQMPYISNKNLAVVLNYSRQKKFI